MTSKVSRGSPRWIAYSLSVVLAIICSAARAEQASISAWEAADFRVWGFVPYWPSRVGTTLLNELATLPSSGLYNHVSDVLYISGVRPNSSGNLIYGSGAAQHLTTLKNHAAAHGFRLHMSMLETSPGSNSTEIDAVWTSVVSSPTYRENFVANVTNLLQTYNMSGFNFDWERPNSAEKWGNYTQLARELGNMIKPLGMEMSVCDYGSTDSRWDDSPLFDARVYDQLFIMIYHLGASSSNTYANQKLNLTGQGAEKAFKNDQLTLGVGTWGIAGPAPVTLRTFVAGNPNLAPDVTSISGTYTAINGTTHTSTWSIESRYQVREKTQLALGRGMPGVFSWTLHYDAANNLGLHRVMHHYTAFQRGVPDLNLDGRVDAADANKLADEMGTVPGWTGTNTPARFDNFYLRGNWEKGDRDGNGFVNQQDADWLAGRLAALEVTLPDRLAYTGTFERFHDGRGMAGRWQAVRNGLGQLPETGNFTQHSAGFLSFAGSGPGANLHGNSAVTLRNQNAAEAFDAINTAPRAMRVELAVPIDLAQDAATYVTFLIRQNMAPLSASQLSSPNRTLALEFVDAAGQNQFDFAFHGQQQQFAIRSQADSAGDDVATNGFAPNATYLFVGKIAGNGAGTDTLQASLFPSGSTVGRFIDPGFDWMLTADSSSGFNPLIRQLEFTSLYEANYTVSNVWIGGAHDFFTPTPADFGDFNADGDVDAADYVVWRRGLGTTFTPAHYDVWRTNFGATVEAGGSHAVSTTGEPPGSTVAVPEPASVLISLIAAMAAIFHMTRR